MLRAVPSCKAYRMSSPTSRPSTIEPGSIPLSVISLRSRWS